MSSDVYVCFTEAERPHWWMIFLKQGFSHCFVIEPYYDKWIKYEYGHGAARVDVLTDFDDLRKRCIIVPAKRQKVRGLTRLNTCVGFVKSIIGDNSLCLTPFQLFRRLVNARYR